MPIENETNAITDLNTNRNIFGIYHTAIKKLVQKNIHSFSEQEYFNLIKKKMPEYKNFKFNQFVFVTMVLSELNIINIINNTDYYEITINSNVNNQLTNSSIYNFVNLFNTVNTN